MYLLALVLGFSLERGPETPKTPLGRALAENDEPCKQSCDSGHDRHCDEQDSTGEWTLSCDLHPTTSCDADCHYPPPPPLAPWMGASGTCPSPLPPPPPPKDAELLRAAWIYFLVALLLFLCCSCYGIYHFAGSRDGRMEGRERIAYWFCCCLTCWRSRGDHWDQEERNAQSAKEREATALPPVLIR